MVKDKTGMGEAFLRITEREGIKIKILSSASLPVSHALSLPTVSIVHFADTGYCFCFFTVRHKDMELKHSRKKLCRTRFLNQASLPVNFSSGQSPDRFSRR
jgi:hypothetical protein